MPNYFGVAVLLFIAAVASAQTPVVDTGANRKVVDRFLEAVDRGDLDAAVATFAEDSINNGRQVTREQLKAVLQDIKTRFPDARLTTVRSVAEGEWVVLQAIYSGTHRGVGRLPVDGGMLVGVPPTGKSFEVQTIHMFRVVSGTIKEHHANRDDIGMMRQLGLLPPPASPR